MRIRLLAVIMWLSAGQAISQTTTSSPYTRYGIGDLNSDGLAASFGMGGFGVAYAPFGQINTLNPANYAVMVRHKPVFDIGVKYNYLSLQTETASDELVNVGLRNVAFAFPIGNKGGFGFGLHPYSSVGYEMVDVQNYPDIGDVEFNYQGEGGMNRVHLGGAYRVVDKERSLLAFGLSGSYLFGTISHFGRTIFPTGAGHYNTKVENSITMSDFKVDAGLYYSGQLDTIGNVFLHMGAVFNSGSEVNATRTHFSQNYIDLGGFNEFLIDTIAYDDSVKGYVNLPLGLNYGMALEFKNLGKSESRLVLGVEYRLQDWSKYKQVFNSEETTDNLRNSYQLSFGMQFTPTTLNESNCGINLFRRMNYRAGFRYNSTQLQINDTEMTEIGISFGLGLPIASCNTPSMINIGAEFGQRGTTDNQLIKEQFATVYVGLSLSPWKNDDWFEKREYD